ncbi:MAG: triphosphoribosyl-dephospho-CoA synthase [Deltaproteobacteria bacterium]|nr:triphosphoribosyl-dephospho-CoA synthase [Deltaproteobacteria bacterium]
MGPQPSSTQVNDILVDPGTLAHLAMVIEVSTSPKPGLVCPDNQGAHQDMDYQLFLTSANSLKPYLMNCYLIGQNLATLDPPSVFKALKTAGKEADQTMLTATSGVNTHKGAIFTLGILVGASGILAANNQPITPKTICQTAALMVEGIVDKELIKLRQAVPNRPLSAGEKLFLMHGTMGIRKEAQDGFPTALRAFESLRYLKSIGISLETALPQIFLGILVEADDSNLIWRGGVKGLKTAKQEAIKALKLGGMLTAEGRYVIDSMVDKFVVLNLSPGGSADLLAAAIFFLLIDRIEQLCDPDLKRLLGQKTKGHNEQRPLLN